jgi:hypothetical protein
MKYTYILLLSLLISGCVRKKSTIEFTGSTPGIKNGVFIIKTIGDSTVYGVNIKDGRFILKEQQLKYPDYYKLNITDNDKNDRHDAFEVYLESGKYTVETEVGKLYKYPKITSPSKIQEQLSTYYTLVDKLNADTKIETAQLNSQVSEEGRRLSPEAFTKLLNKLSAAENKPLANNAVAFKAFVKQYPDSEVSTHLMSKLNYEADPVTWYAIYQTLTPAAKNSDDGKEIGDKLSHLVKLVAGVKAPALSGKMADGKQFDPATMNKKLILIDFWRASNEISRRNHEKMAGLLASQKDKGTLGIVSVSIDTKRDWWMSAIAEDHMTWPQVSDLKGDDSPNAANWSITKIPTYYLLDGNWKIVERDIYFDKLDFEIKYYLNKHH